MMRLDSYLFENGFAKSRTHAQSLIKEQLVKVNGKVVTKASFEIENDNIEVLKHDAYVSRGAYKLLGAIEQFNLNFQDKVVADLGSSTGGFTEVALKFGAKKVYSIDVGTDVMDKKLRLDKRIVLMEQTDIRNIADNQLSDVDIVVGDLSFISLTKILPAIKNIWGTDKEMMLLFKPQFECGKEIAKKCHGVIKDEKIHAKLIKDFICFALTLGFNVKAFTESPIKGGDGNTEFLLHFKQ